MRAIVSVSRTSTRRRSVTILQELVAGGMAEGVVHGLEVVEIEQVDRHHLAAPDAGERVLEPLVQQHAVGQVGQRVVQRHVHDLGLRAALLGDVLVRDDVAAVRRLTIGDVDDAPVGELMDRICDLAELGDELVRELARVRSDVAAVGQTSFQISRTVVPGRTCSRVRPYIVA